MNTKTAKPRPVSWFHPVLLLWLILLWSTSTYSEAPPAKRVDSALKADLQAAVTASTLEKIDQRAFDLFTSALFMEYSGDLESAAQLYDRALDYFAASYEIRFSLAAALYNLRRPGQALDQIKKLPKLDGQSYGLAAACYRALNDPNSAAVAYLRQIQFDTMSIAAYSFLTGYYRTKEKPDSAVWAYRNLIRLLPENTQIRNELGRIEAQRGNLDSALVTFSQSVAVANDTSNAQAVISLSEMYEMKGQIDSATAVLEAAVRDHPDFLGYRHSLINVYARMDSVRLALPHARYVAQRFPNDEFAARRLGILYFSLDSLAKSDSIFTSLNKSGAVTPLNYYYLGRGEMRRKNWEGAVSQFQKMTAVSDTSAAAWISLSAAYRQLNDTAKTIEVLREGTRRIRGEKAALDLYYALGAAYEQLGQVDSARSVFEILLSHAPNFAQALNYLGYMFADRNVELDSAKSLIARALEMEPNNGAYLDSYGWVLYRQGLFDDALKYLLKAADRQPDPTVFEHIGDVYHKLNNSDSAKVWWNKSHELQPDNKLLKQKLEN